MFAPSYFAPSYFAPTYFPGAEGGPLISVNDPPTIWLTIGGGPIYVTRRPTYIVTGHATYSLNPVTQVTWANNRGGSGTATGTNPWYAALILQPGTNVLTFTATDSVGATESTWIVVIYTTYTPSTIVDAATILPPL